MKPNIFGLLRVASAAFFVVWSSAVMAQNNGTVTNHALPIGKGAGVQGFGSLLLGSGQIAIGQSSANPNAVTPTGDVTINAAGATAIGANKVTNSQLNTMVANTTKCNATAGTTNPTDCTATTMKTNLGLVIGTNVEAWDTDLDCLAALSSTGVIHRTGSGTCSAGSVALSDLVTGTQDTVLGYFGSTAASALAINNCSNALTYSTSTHTFGCNVSAGTGTVTEQKNTAGYGITLSGNCDNTSTNAGSPCNSAVSLTSITNSIGSNVSFSTTAYTTTGPSIAQGTTGTWWASGQVTIITGSAAIIYCKLWDGTTVIASGGVNNPSAGRIVIPLSGFIASPAANISIQCNENNSASNVMQANTTGNGKDSTVSAYRIQ